jgi:flagellar basal-body rod protein FlgG
VVDFPEKTALEKIGDNLFRQNEASGEPFLVQSQVIQESLERSNVNSVTEMVNLITAMRAYEANQRSIHAHDETLGKAVNDVGRLG